MPSITANFLAFLVQKSGNLRRLKVFTNHGGVKQRKNRLQKKSLKIASEFLAQNEH